MVKGVGFIKCLGFFHGNLLSVTVKIEWLSRISSTMPVKFTQRESLIPINIENPMQWLMNNVSVKFGFTKYNNETVGF